MVSRLLTLTLPYDNHAMYTFTYANVNTPSLSEAQYCSHLVLRVGVQWITYRVCVAALM